MALSEAKKRAAIKWQKENTYKFTIQFTNNNFSKEKYEKVKEKLKEMGMSKNEYVLQAFKKLIGDE